MKTRLEGQLEFEFMEGLESKDRKIIDYIGAGLMITSTAIVIYAAYLTVVSEVPPIKSCIDYIGGIL